MVIRNNVTNYNAIIQQWLQYWASIIIQTTNSALLKKAGYVLHRHASRKVSDGLQVFINLTNALSLNLSYYWAQEWEILLTKQIFQIHSTWKWHTEPTSMLCATSNQIIAFLPKKKQITDKLNHKRTTTYTEQSLP